MGEAPGDIAKQSLGFERLSKEALGADRDCFIVQLLVRQGRDQNDGYHAALILELSYEVESTHSGHMNVSDDAVEEEQVGPHQERLCRREGLGAIANGTHQI